MVLGKEGFQNKPEVDWDKELGSELPDPMFSYIIPNNPLVIEKFVTAAVYKTLSGEEIISKEIGRYIHDSPSIKDEVAEHDVRDMMDYTRDILSRSTGFHYEQQEAIKQGKKAKADIAEYGSFSANYDYWLGMPLKSSVNLRPVRGFPEHLSLASKLSEINTMKGFPDDLLYREVNLEKLPKDSNSVFEFAQKSAAKLGVNPSDFMQSMFDKQGIIFVEAMNNCGHTNFDKVRTAIVSSGERGHKTYSPDEMFKMLSGKEKDLVQKPAKEKLNVAITRELESGKSKATFSLNTWTEGMVWYDSKKQKIEGELIPSKNAAIYLGLRPTITPDTTHPDLLDIRRKGQFLAKDLGFPEKHNINWF